jgi:hypothetical protein
MLLTSFSSGLHASAIGSGRLWETQSPATKGVAAMTGSLLGYETTEGVLEAIP